MERTDITVIPSQPAPATTPAPTTPRDRAPKLNPPKPFDGTRADYKSYIMQLNLMFNSDPDRYTGVNADNAKIAYAASFLSDPAKEWFQPHVDETTGTIAFPTWTEFVAPLRAAFEDPDAYQTAYNKISSSKKAKDCSSYYAAFVSLATILGLDDRTKISFFKQGLHAELKKALSYQITLPTGFGEFVQACIKSITKSEQIGKLVMPYHVLKEATLPEPPVPAPAPILAPWTYLGLDTAPRSEALSPIKKRSVAGTTICAYIVACLAIGPPNAPIRNLGESPLPLPLSPLKEVCPFPLLCLYCPPLLSPLPKSSMRQKTKFRCS